MAIKSTILTYFFIRQNVGYNQNNVGKDVEQQKLWFNTNDNERWEKRFIDFYETVYTLPYWNVSHEIVVDNQVN